MCGREETCKGARQFDNDEFLSSVAFFEFCGAPVCDTVFLDVCDVISCLREVECMCWQVYFFFWRVA